MPLAFTACYGLLWTCYLALIFAFLIEYTESSHPAIIEISKSNEIYIHVHLSVLIQKRNKCNCILSDQSLKGWGNVIIISDGSEMMAWGTGKNGGGHFCGPCLKREWSKEVEIKIYLHAIVKYLPAPFMSLFSNTLYGELLVR